MIRRLREAWEQRRRQTGSSARDEDADPKRQAVSPDRVDRPLSFLLDLR